MRIAENKVKELPGHHTSPHFSVRHEGASIQQMEVLPVEWTVHHGSHPEGQGRQRPWSKLRGQQVALGDPANPQAAMRVKPEQASKVKLRMPTRLRNGEGRCAPGKQPSRAPGAVRRGSGSGMWGRSDVQRGKTCRVRGRSPQRLGGGRPGRGSDGPIVPLKPGNAGGGKGPCFWGAFEGGPEGRLA